MKLKIILLLLISITFTGCSDDRPIYESGMTKKDFGEMFGNWLGNKIADNANEAQIEKYKNKTTDLVKKYQQEVNALESKEDVLLTTDNMITDIVSLSENTYGLNLDDWNYIANPEVDESASKQSQLEIKYILKQISAILPSYKVGYLPSHLDSPVRKSLESKNDGDVYYHVLMNSKYKEIIANDKWLHEYKSKEIILKTAKSIAVSEGLYFDVDLNELENNNREIKNIENEYGKHFDRKIKNIIKPQKTIYQFADIFKSKSINDFKINTSNSLQIAQKKHQNAINNKSKQSTITYLKSNVDYELEGIKTANINIENTYNENIRKLNELLEKIKTLKSNESQFNYYHNVKIFVTTYNELLNKNLDDRDISKYLSNGRWLYKAKEYDISNHINLDRSDSMALEEYLKTMKKLLSV